MTSMISIVDTSGYFNTNNAFKVVVSDHEDNIVMLNGVKAIKYLNETILSGYNNTVFGSESVDSGILPPGVRVVGKNYVVFERPPTYQNVFFNPEKLHSGMREENILTYRIPIPWQVYVAKFTNDYYLSDVSMYFSNTSLISKEQYLYLPPLPNFYTDGSLCRPMFSDMNDVERYPKNLSGMVACAYDWIWNNGTNNDLNEAMVHVNLQLAIHAEKYNSTIFSKMSKEEYIQTSFENPYGVTYYHSTQVAAIFKTWEKSTLEQVLSYSWPVPSFDKHFSAQYYHSNYSDITEHPQYFNWLGDWARDYYQEESSEDIEYLIDNGDYDGDAYFDYVSNNHISPTPVQFKNITCQTIIDKLASESYSNIKNTFASYVAKAFLKTENTSESNG